MRQSQASLGLLLFLIALPVREADRRISLQTYRNKLYGAWIGQIVGASYGFNFEGQARNAIELDHFLDRYDAAIVDDDYYYEMVALYGFERYGINMTVEQLGEMWREYKRERGGRASRRDLRSSLA